MVPRKPQSALLTTAIVLINAAVLTVLLFGPNSPHPNVSLMRSGIALVALGVILMLLAALRSRGDRRPF
jgi:hypothetical protein